MRDKVNIASAMSGIVKINVTLKTNRKNREVIIRGAEYMHIIFFCLYRTSGTEGTMSMPAYFASSWERKMNLPHVTLRYQERMRSVQSRFWLRAGILLSILLSLIVHHLDLDNGRARKNIFAHSTEFEAFFYIILILFALKAIYGTVTRPHGISVTDAIIVELFMMA
jgi:hypothetical protein